MKSSSPVAPDRLPPVLVLGTGLTALGVIRVLSRSRLQPFCVNRNDGMLQASRFYRTGGLPPLAAPEELPSWLAGLPLKRAVLMPCADTWVEAVAALDPALATRFPSSQGSWPVLRAALDKGRFLEAVEAADVAHPDTWLLEGEESLRAVPDHVFPTAFLKPRDSQRFHATYGVKAFRIGSRAEAVARWREVTRAGLALMLQEYVPGGADAHVFVDGFVDRGGVVRAVFVRRRLRMYPPDFGNSSLMVSIPPDEASSAVAAVHRLLAHLGYRGIFSAEFKRDARDEVYRILEVNARPWWYIEFTARCGMDLCAMAYRDALTEPVATVTEYVVGRRCIYPYYDWFAIREAPRSGASGLLGWVGTVLRSTQPVFRWDDPLPALVEGVGQATGAIPGLRPRAGRGRTPPRLPTPLP